MSSTEEIEAKTGRSPATKVGGVRHANIRHRTVSEEVKNPAPVEEVEDNEEEDDSPEKEAKSKPKPLIMWGGERDPAKDYPTEAIQHMQNKPVPTHQMPTKPASARPQVIQQPR